MRNYVRFWAKSAGKDWPSHSLFAHMLDVAAVALEILEREPASTVNRYAQVLGFSPDETKRWFAGIAAGHDLGKATPLFQSKWEPGYRQVCEAGFSFPRTVSTSRRGKEIDVSHNAMTAGLLDRWLRERNVPFRPRHQVSLMVGAHHGFVPRSDEVNRGENCLAKGDQRWAIARDELLQDILSALDLTIDRHWMSLANVPDDVLVAVGAITSVSDWIASDRELFPRGRQVVTPSAYLSEARELAQAALDRIGWFHRRPLPMASFTSRFGFEPNPLQRLVSSMLTDVTGAALLVIEAPMGMGKTEAALYAHTYLQNVCNHRGLYVAMPTVATGNGMYTRVLEFLSKISSGPVDVQLQHGSAILNTEYRSLRVSNVGDDDAEGAVLASEWFSAKKRAMLSEYGVGTVDQALLAALRVRHHFVRLFGLANRTVVFDEVHAYDAYTTTLIETLLSWLSKQGSSVILLSATLPRAKRNRLLAAYGAEPGDEAISYPRVTLAQPGRKSTAKSYSIDQTSVVELRGLPLDTSVIASTGIQLAQQGGCVAYVANTVRRAQEVYQAVGPGEPIVQIEGDQKFIIGKVVDGMEIYLFHARYPSADRRARELNTLRLFGKDGYISGQRPRKAFLIATQVIEQSLNVDFDSMITDLTPIDLLLQRLGRLHRFIEAMLRLWGYRRPERHSTPVLWVSGLGPNPPSLGDWSSVYKAYLILMTWWLLKRRTRITLPEEIESLIEAVYGEFLPDSLEPDVRSIVEPAYHELMTCIDCLSRRANDVALRDGDDLVRPPRDTVTAGRLEDDEEQAFQMLLTRHGEPSVLAVPLHRVKGSLCLDEDGQFPVSWDSAPTDEEALRIFDRSVRLAGQKIVHALRSKKPPEVWRHHPLLRTLRHLELINGRQTLGETQLILDKELGIVYQA